MNPERGRSRAPKSTIGVVMPVGTSATYMDRHRGLPSQRRQAAQIPHHQGSTHMSHSHIYQSQPHTNARQKGKGKGRLRSPGLSTEKDDLADVEATDDADLWVMGVESSDRRMAGQAAAAPTATHSFAAPPPLPPANRTPTPPPSSSITSLRKPHSRPALLFPYDEASEQDAVCTLWTLQGRSRRAMEIVTSDGLVRLPDDAGEKGSNNQVAESTSPGSSTSSGPSALFSSIITSTSASTVTSPVTYPEAKHVDHDATTPRGSLVFSGKAKESSAVSVLHALSSLSRPTTPHRTVTPSPKSILIPVHESPLHFGSVSPSSPEAYPREKHRHQRSQSLTVAGARASAVAPHFQLRRNSLSLLRPRPRTPAPEPESGSALSSTWHKTFEDFLSFVGHIPSAYLPPNTKDAIAAHPRYHSYTHPRPRSHSAPSRLVAPSHPSRLASSPHPHPFLPTPPASPSQEHDDPVPLVPLNMRPTPSPPRKIPAIPTLPRSPYRPLTPPPHPAPRLRLVANPQFLRLKAVQNRVMWGLVGVSIEEWEVLRKGAWWGAGAGGDGLGSGGKEPGRAGGGGRDEVDREGRFWTGKEAVVGVAVEGGGRSGLSFGLGAEGCWVAGGERARGGHWWWRW